MRLTKRRCAALAAALLGTALGVTPLTTANAAAVAMTLHASGAIDTVGTPANITMTLTTPPPADSFVELDLSTENAAHLTVTDVAGTALPHEPVYTNDRIATFRLGEEDSDHDGIPGATLTPDSLRVRATADGYVGTTLNISAYYIDGATGNRIPMDTANFWMEIKQPYLSPTWSSPHWSAVSVGMGEPIYCYLATSMELSPPPASTRTRLMFTAQQIAKAGYTAAQLARDVRVQRSGDKATYTERPWKIGSDGSLMLEISEHTWAAGEVGKGDYLRISAVRGLPVGHLTGAFQSFGPDGTQLSWAPQTLDFIDQAAFYGRDGSGVLWQYRSSPSIYSRTPTARAEIGGGWNTYTALTKLSTLKADGTGDLVARDRAGVLWLYKATGTTNAPFATRSKVGGGWNTYTQLAGPGDLTGDGTADLLARDKTGVLWLYRGTGTTSSPFSYRTRVGGGWNTYTQLVGGTDLTGDGKADLLARDSDGVLWLNRGTGSAGAPFTARTRIGGGWNAYTHLVSTGDLTADGINDLIATDPGGALWLYTGTSDVKAPFTARNQIGKGWTIYNALT
ncbi:FG-GAP repeat domain-containing protein [Streptomyces sp. NPDC005780]|uniref:FG-GAP repeat domain-containing protein n=1 Tax=Streptomyces sp. NPDC005780 TaxID=3364730 RepID=UPI0036B1AE84